MRRVLFFIFLLAQALCLGVDFDIVVIGSSPIPLIEALYQAHLGKRVLILEEASVCGGAWKSIDICGVYPVDLGCHTLGKDKRMLKFLETHLGCRMVSLDNPRALFDIKNSPNGFYPLQGCYEIIHNLLELIKKTDIVLLLEHPLESITIHPNGNEAMISSRGMYITASKIIVPSFCSLQFSHHPMSISTTDYYHLYLLIEDPTPPNFSFRSGILTGASRLMNLTHFAGLTGTNKQLIVIQTYGKQPPATSKNYLETLIKQGLLHPTAHILEEEVYVYKQKSSTHYHRIPQATNVIQNLNTAHIEAMLEYIPKWEKILKPYDVALSCGS